MQEALAATLPPTTPARPRGEMVWLPQAAAESRMGELQARWEAQAAPSEAAQVLAVKQPVPGVRRLALVARSLAPEVWAVTGVQGEWPPAVKPAPAWPWHSTKGSSTK